MRPRHASPAAQAALAALAYLLLSIVITYPVAFRLNTHAAGYVWGDTYEFIWHTWWFKHSLLDLQANPLYINILNYPQGLYVPLLAAMSQSFALTLPLAAVFSPLVAFNLVYLLSFPLCGLAACWLCREISGDWRAGFAGGLIWAFFPNKMGHALGGHLFQMVVFSLPLAALMVLRLLRQPSARQAIWAGLAVALAATIHPINVAYVLAPLVAVLAGVELWRRWRARPGPATEWRWLALAAVVALAVAVPFYLPALLDSARGRLDYLVTGGTVGFSTDLLALFVPPPQNPIVLRTPLVPLSERVVRFEFEGLAYIGWAPLALAVLGARGRWAEGRAWVILGAAAAVLSLGPLLKANGGLVRIPVENEAYPLIMPYVVLEHLPFFEWSRTPGRLNQTVMLAVAVLAALGMAQLLRRLRPWPGWAVLGGASAVIVLEHLVVWPWPAFPVAASPAFTSMAADRSFGAVLNVPVIRTEHIAQTLFQQTLHRHPMIGGRVLRDVPGSLVLHSFLSGLLEAPVGADIAPGPTQQQRRAALAYYDVGRIVYHPEFDRDGSTGLALEQAWADQFLAREADLGVIAVEPAEPQASDLFFVFGDNWHAPEMWNGRPGRWFHTIATVYLFSGSPRSGSLRFTAVPAASLRHLLVKVNGRESGYFGVGDWAGFETPELPLQEGLNVVEFIDPEGAWTFVGDPRCLGGSEVAGPYPAPVPCDAARQGSGQYSLAIQGLSFGAAATAQHRPLFGETFELLTQPAALRARPGDTLRLPLAWRAGRGPGRDYTVFVHLSDAAGAWVAGYDSFPARGQSATSGWRPGEVLAHNVPLAIPSDAAPGAYVLSVGWYDPATGERLALAGGETTAAIGTVELRP
jgi:hypothetical protein